MKLTLNVPSEVEEPLNDKCKKTKKDPSDLVESLLEWYFLKRRKPEINELGNANDFLKIADYCAKERMYNCEYSDIDNCTRDVKVQASKTPRPLHPYMCLFCSHFKDKREKEEQGEQVQERKEQGREEDRDHSIDEHKIARIAAGIVMEQYGSKLNDHPPSSEGYKPNENNLNENGFEEVDFEEFEEEIEEEAEFNKGSEEDLITRDKVEKLLDDW
ncbi:MAG: hypothetical protein R6U44_04570 [Archaeoglobaceae archaeon]